jgi:hypothetical protein
MDESAVSSTSRKRPSGCEDSIDAFALSVAFASKTGSSLPTSDGAAQAAQHGLNEVDDKFTDLAPSVRTHLIEREKMEPMGIAHPDRVAASILVRAKTLGQLFATDLARMTGEKMDTRLCPLSELSQGLWLRIVWTAAAEPAGLSWCLTLSPSELSLSTGVASPDRERLAEFRQSIAWDPDRWLGVIHRSGGRLSDWGMPRLAGVPPPWRDDHPAADLLRRTSLVLSIEFETEDAAGGLLPVLRLAASRALPFWHICR